MSALRLTRPLSLAATLTLLAFCACERGKKTLGMDTPPGPVAPVVSVNVLHTWPHDTSAFTQGLVWNGSQLFESTGRNCCGSLRRVELETGRVLQRTPVSEQYFAEGLALLGGKLYQLTWQNQLGMIYDTTGLRQVGTFTYTGEGWGLTTDGHSLVLSDGSNQLRFIDPASWREQRVVNVKDGAEYVNDLNELEWVKGEVWANVWHTDRIARIDPVTGRVKGWVDLTGVMGPLSDPEAVLNGIAYDAAHDRLFITGKLWPNLFEIAVPGIAGGGGRAETPAAAKP